MKQRRYSEELKNQLIKEAQEVGNATLVARKHGISPNVLTRWIRESKGIVSLKSNGLHNPANKSQKQLEQENEKLKMFLGERDLYNHIRIHGSINDYAPVEYYHAVQRGKIKGSAIKL
jgi:transposase InsO family protein